MWLKWGWIWHDGNLWLYNMFTPRRAPGEGREEITLKSISPSLLGVHCSIMEVKKQNAVTHLAEELCVFLHSSYQTTGAVRVSVEARIVGAVGKLQKQEGWDKDSTFRDHKNKNGPDIQLLPVIWGNTMNYGSWRNVSMRNAGRCTGLSLQITRGDTRQHCVLVELAAWLQFSSLSASNHQMCHNDIVN